MLDNTILWQVSEFVVTYFPNVVVLGLFIVIAYNVMKEGK